MEHDSVLKLCAGPDFLLKTGSLALVSSGYLSLLFSPVSWWIKTIIFAVFSVLGYLIYYWDHEASETRLSLFPDGRVGWETSSGRRGRAVLSTGHWLSPRYLVVTASQHGRSHRFLVSRSLQPDDNFRVLRTWIRLGLPKESHSTGAG